MMDALIAPCSVTSSAPRDPCDEADVWQNASVVTRARESPSTC